jgi:hypothetical protein
MTTVIYNCKAHTKDTDCNVDPDTMLCRICSVEHADQPCAHCGARAYHLDNCPTVVFA